MFSFVFKSLKNFSKGFREPFTSVYNFPYITIENGFSDGFKKVLGSKILYSVTFLDTFSNYFLKTPFLVVIILNYYIEVFDFKILRTIEFILYDIMFLKVSFIFKNLFVQVV